MAYIPPPSESSSASQGLAYGANANKRGRPEDLSSPLPGMNPSAKAPRSESGVQDVIYNRSRREYEPEGHKKLSRFIAEDPSLDGFDRDALQETIRDKCYFACHYRAENKESVQDFIRKKVDYINQTQGEDGVDNCTDRLKNALIQQEKKAFRTRVMDTFAPVPGQDGFGPLIELDNKIDKIVSEEGYDTVAYFLNSDLKIKAIQGNVQQNTSELQRFLNEGMSDEYMGKMRDLAFKLNGDVSLRKTLDSPEAREMCGEIDDMLQALQRDAQERERGEQGPYDLKHFCELVKAGNIPAQLCLQECREELAKREGATPPFFITGDNGEKTPPALIMPAGGEPAPPSLMTKSGDGTPPPFLSVNPPADDGEDSEKKKKKYLLAQFLFGTIVASTGAAHEVAGIAGILFADIPFLGEASEVAKQFVLVAGSNAMMIVAVPLTLRESIDDRKGLHEVKVKHDEMLGAVASGKAPVKKEESVLTEANMRASMK